MQSRLENCVTQKEFSELIRVLEQKADIADIREELEHKASKQSVVSAL